ncbi:MAG: stage V sporulation T C-terminal domain-containing protein [Butyribacter sp.]|nr:stage V sporulation T C-terminal domain-containing protein [bacterium]MDY3853889.1 stage V sporulation T C-terminal domain-containing protein [Butyribacter sp.]
MKATGIVRRIDDLGRVVIPKEIRTTLRIREADSLEIYTDRDGEIILKKYSPVAEMGEVAKQYVEALAQVSGNIAAVTDRERFIAVSPNGKKELLQKVIHPDLEKVIFDRKKVMAAAGSEQYVKLTNEGISYKQEVIYPVISQGDVIGSVMLLSKDSEKKPGIEEESLLAYTSKILGAQIE